MTENGAASRIHPDIDLAREGKQTGDLLLRSSDNRQPLGHYPVPVLTLARGDGPTVLLISGVHGDEFEGPSALMRLFNSLAPEDVTGRLIILPALNTPAVQASSRVSPLDGVNMNRVFPGDPNGGPTAMLAHFLEEVLMPQCDAAIDLHSGGKASVFASCALASEDDDPEHFEKNLALARAFGAPLIWQLGAYNDNRSVNAAATRKRVPMIATELGGGGGCDPQDSGLGEAGVRRCLAHLGVIAEAPLSNASPRIVSVSSSSQSLYAPAAGVFDRHFRAGDEVVAGASAGWLHFVDEPQRPSIELRFPENGLVLAHGARGMVERGELLAFVARDVAAQGGEAG